LSQISQKSIERSRGSGAGTKIAVLGLASQCCGLHDHPGWSVTAKTATCFSGQIQPQRTSAITVVIEWKQKEILTWRSVSFLQSD